MIRWISDRIGTAGWTETEEGAGYTRLDVRILSDGSGNAAETMLRLLSLGAKTLQSGDKLVVACHFGISRSNAVAAGVLSLIHREPLHLSLARVARNTGEQQIHAGVIRTVEEALRALDPDLVLPTGSTQEKILITGGHGFIGKTLRPKLGSSDQIVCPTRAELDIARSPLDLNLLIRRENIRTIVHLSFPRKIATNASMGEALNQLKNILDAASANHCRLIIPGSWVVDGGLQTSELLANEGTAFQPKDTYGETRVLCETLIRLHRTRARAPIHLLRFPPIYGPGTDRPAFLFSCFERARAGRAIETHRFINGEPRLDYLHVDDAAEALVAAVKHPSTESHDFNVGSGRLISTREAAQQIQDLHQVTTPIGTIPMNDWIGNILLDSAKFSKATGWKPTIPFELGIRDIARSLDKIQNRIQA